ncbi:metal-dependent hydrolase, partial [Burkholderia thailandensis]|nr:metal-dependent hydrolase [Burkholderia thailandensis]
MSIKYRCAILSNPLLSSYEHRIYGSVEGSKHMWRSHAREATEHKAVSYARWIAVMKSAVNTYSQRSAPMPASMLIFCTVLSAFRSRLIFALWTPNGHQTWRCGLSQLVDTLRTG